MTDEPPYVSDIHNECNLEIHQLKQELAAANAKIAAMECEKECSMLLLSAAKNLLLASTGPDDGPISWSETRQRWVDNLDSPQRLEV